MILRIRLFKLRVVFAVAVLIAVMSTHRFTFGRLPEGGGLGLAQLNAPVPVISTTLMVGDSSKVFQKVNNERRLRKLKPMLWNENLSDLAADYSRKMADEDFFSHFDADGMSVADRAEEADITDWKKIGENLFMSEGYPDVSEVAVKGWMKSRTHRTNILDSEWTHTGVGVYKTPDGRTYVTQVFMTK